jgi:hypothetical protein
MSHELLINFLISCMSDKRFQASLHCIGYSFLSNLLGTLFFRGIIFIATERCCFAQLLKVIHSVSDRYSVNIVSEFRYTFSDICIGTGMASSTNWGMTKFLNERLVKSLKN